MSETLLGVLRSRFGLSIDPDSNPGKILDTLTPLHPFDDTKFDGTASVSNLAFVPSSEGLSVRAAHANDGKDANNMLVWQIPDQNAEFTLIRAPGGDPLRVERVEVVLLHVTLPLPGLHPAQLGQDGMPQQAGKDPVRLVLPPLVLAITETSANLAPAQLGGGGLEVTMQPPLALIGLGTVLGFGFDQAILKLDGPEEPHIQVPSAQIYISPPGIQALQIHGSADNLLIGLGASSGGITGDLTLAQDQGAVTPAKPSFVEHLVAHLRLERSSVVLLELSGQVNIRDAVAQHVGGLDGVEGPDGVDFTLGLTLYQDWQVGLKLTAAPGQGFLWRTHSDGHSKPRDTLGAYTTFGPLLNSGLSNASSGGEIVDLALDIGLAAGMGVAGIIHAPSVTLYGAELVVRQKADGGTELLLFFEVEAEVTVQAAVIETTQPIKIRQKAIGLRLNFGADPGSPVLFPVFDTARGYDLDLSDPGLFKVRPDFLADILQPERTRMSHGSPLNLEIDLAPRLDLGVVKVDKTSVRIPIDEIGSQPSLTGLGVSLDVPGLLSGSGYLQITRGGFAGKLDASLAQLGLRVSAGLALSQIPLDKNPPDAVGFVAAIEVDFPLPIPFGTSGLGLMGVLGLFGMHYQRNMDPNESVLQWYVRADGKLTEVLPDFWAPQLKHWAFGVGAKLGTMEGGFLLNLKGALVIEAPGPQVLIFMNASLLSLPPVLEHANNLGAILAVIQISPDLFSIGMAINYSIEPLLEISIPVQASFSRKDIDNWNIYLGTFANRATVKFLFTMRAAGYLMIQGKPIEEQDFPLKPHGAYTLAAGLKAAIIWGPEPIGLYLEVAATIDVAISFKPFMIIGKLGLSGSLHLFIVSIEVSTDAEVKIISPSSEAEAEQTSPPFYISGEVCGEVDFLLTSVQGCVKLELGVEPKSLPPAEPLVRAVSLHSRTPALLVGSGSDRPVDGSLGDAKNLDHPVVPEKPVPIVPIDAIPVIQFEMRPAVDPDLKFLGQPVLEKLPQGDWVRRGGRFYRYTLKSIELSADRAAVNPPVGPGEVKNVWWDRDPGPGGDNDVQLALFNWLPDPTPSAAEHSGQLDTLVQRRWGNLCQPIAPAASVLWTFLRSTFGPARSGWNLEGIPWTDPPGTVRFADPPHRLLVTEPWRTGNFMADTLVSILPAHVDGGLILSGGRGLLAPFPSSRNSDPKGDGVPARVEGSLEFTALFNLARPSGIKSLPDSLRFEIGLSVSVRVLLIMNKFVRELSRLVIQFLDAFGNPVGPQISLNQDNLQLVKQPADFPKEWLDPNGPWAADMSTLAGQPSDPNWLTALFTTRDLPPGAAMFELGQIGGTADIPLWGILAIETLSQAEVARVDIDEETRRPGRSLIPGALGVDASLQALLLPDTIYTLKVSYTVEVTDADENGNARKDGIDPGTRRDQSFTFQTDNVPPTRLDPWVMATDPGPDESFVFYRDPIRILFSTNATRKLFKSYGKDLFAVARAASGHHPAGKAGLFDPSKVSLVNTIQPVLGLKAQVFTPWESAARQVLADLAQNDPECIPEMIIETPRHEITFLTLDLDPLTNYILDITTDPDGVEQPNPLFRRRFSTSRYPTMQAMAEEVDKATLQHRFLEDIAALAKLSGDHPMGEPPETSVRVGDLEFENALRSVGWGDFAPARQPQVTVIWQASGGTFQPVAVLIVTPEPLWRWRDLPAEIKDVNNVRRYRLKPTKLLEVVETPPGTPLVNRLVFSPGGGRTLVLLNPGARGGQLHLDLHRIHMDLRRIDDHLFEQEATTESATLVDIGLKTAPWEE
jgi:hypothetical protein